MWSYRPNAEDSSVLNRDSGVLTIDGQNWTMPSPGTTIPSSLDVNPGVRTSAAATDTLVLADAGKTVYYTNNSAAAITIPLNASVAFPLNSRVEMLGTLVAISIATAGTLVVPDGSLASALSAGSTVAVRKIATDTWVLSGDLAAT